MAGRADDEGGDGDQRHDEELLHGSSLGRCRRIGRSWRGTRPRQTKPSACGRDPPPVLGSGLRRRYSRRGGARPRAVPPPPGSGEGCGQGLEEHAPEHPEDDAGSSDARLVDGLRRRHPRGLRGAARALRDRHLQPRPARGPARAGRRGHHPGRAASGPSSACRGTARCCCGLAVPAHAQPLLRLPARVRPAPAPRRRRDRRAVSAGPLRAVGAAGASRGSHRRPDPAAARGAAARRTSTASRWSRWRRVWT